MKRIKYERKQNKVPQLFVVLFCLGSIFYDSTLVFETLTYSFFLLNMFQKLFGFLFGEASKPESPQEPIKHHISHTHIREKKDFKKIRPKSSSIDGDAEDEYDPNDHDAEYKNAASEIINVIPIEEPHVKILEPNDLIKLVEQFSFQVPIPKKPSEEVLVRPIVYSDRQCLEEAIRLGEVSARSLFFRFTRAIKRFSDAQLDYFTCLDYEKHFALGLALAQPGYKGIATARYIMDDVNDKSAEWAVIVMDRYQGLGLGTMLFYALCQAAYVRGIKQLRAVVHPDNHSVLDWMKKANAIHKDRGNTSFWLFDLPLPDHFLYDPELEEKIKKSFQPGTKMNEPAKCFLLQQIKNEYNVLSQPSSCSSRSNSEGVVCGSYRDIVNSRSFSSSNSELNKRIEELSASSESSEIEDFDFTF
ncbi:hypothetical protein WA158_004924 [Blastocystis sp. Blastoise]